MVRTVKLCRQYLQSFISKYQLPIVSCKLTFRLIVPMIFIALPPNYFDNGASICVSKWLFGIECLACGMTRACMHFIHFQFEEAFAYNMMSFIAFPVIAAFWLYLFITEYKLFVKLRKARG